MLQVLHTTQGTQNKDMHPRPPQRMPGSPVDVNVRGIQTHAMIDIVDVVVRNSYLDSKPAFIGPYSGVALPGVLFFFIPVEAFWSFWFEPASYRLGMEIIP